MMRSFNNLKGSSLGEMSYEQLLVKVKELENDNI